MHNLILQNLSTQNISCKRDDCAKCRRDSDDIDMYDQEDTDGQLLFISIKWRPFAHDTKLEKNILNQEAVPRILGPRQAAKQYQGPEHSEFSNEPP